jgi:hypothetical protein
MRLRLAAAVLLAALALPDHDAAAQAAIPLSYDPAPPARSFSADWHMGRARDFRHSGRLDAALASIDSALVADPATRGAHTMRALVLAEKNDQAGTLGALRRARAAGDTLAFPAAMQVGTAQYRTASLTRKTTDYALALETLQLADSIAPSDDRRAMPRLLVAATALALANGELAATGSASGCPTIAVGRARPHAAREREPRRRDDRARRAGAARARRAAGARGVHGAPGAPAALRLIDRPGRP